MMMAFSSGVLLPLAVVCVFAVQMSTSVTSDPEASAADRDRDIGDIGDMNHIEVESPSRSAEA
jgi:hypothetical protein